MKKLALATLLTTMSISAAHAALTMCVFDPEGQAGVAYGYAKDYVLKMPQLGVPGPVTLKAYTNEAIEAEDFKAGQCDGAIMSNLRARAFNHFTGSLDSVGALTTREELNTALEVLSNKQLAPKMSEGDYEVIGMIPLGAAYVMVDDRSINTLAKAAGKKISVLDFDTSEAKLIQKMGAQPVSVDFTTISGKFNNHQVDITAGPAVMFKPLELWKGMTGPDGNVKGAVIRFPILQVTAAIVVHKNKFNNEEANQKIREYVYSQIGTAYKFIDASEKEIDAKYWMDVPDADKPGYQKLMREARIDMVKDGTYDKDMMHLLKKVRCKSNPTNFECAMNDE